MVALQCTKKIHRALGLGRIAPQAAQQQWQGGTDGVLGLRSAGAQLLGHLLEWGALELGHQFADQRGGGVHQESFQKEVEPIRFHWT